jgi:uncharacterized protein YggU (UPF0235/DUF167 family)
MIGREFKFHDGGKGAALAIRVKSGAKHNKIVKVQKDGTVVVHFQGTGRDINQGLLNFLAQELGVDQNRIHVIAGYEGKNKLISVLQMEPQEIQRLILTKIS